MKWGPLRTAAEVFLALAFSLLLGRALWAADDQSGNPKGELPATRKSDPEAITPPTPADAQNPKDASALLRAYRRAHASGRADSRNPKDASAPNRHLTRGEYLARTALSYRGVPYRFGGTTSRGIDCSGLALKVFRRWGVYLPRTSVQQFTQGKPVAKRDLKPGDLVFFRNTYRSGISHVGIYVGKGKMVHAANERKGVTVSRLEEPYYAHRYAGARRLRLERLPK